MLTSSRQSGFTLIEVLISLAVLGIVVMLGLPSFQSWIQNQQLRLAAEAATNGLQTARAEAIRRNLTTQISFGPNTGWIVSEAVSGTAITRRSHDEGSPNAELAITPGAATTVTFTSLGAVVANVDGTPTASQLDFSNSRGGSCQPAGPMRCLRVTVSAGGTIKMCDPQTSAPDPRAC